MTRLVGVRAVCDGCSAAAATVFCVAHRNVLCLPCDTSRHATPHTSHHQRVDLASAVTALPFCEHCDDAPATTYCESESSTLCDKCDNAVHQAVEAPHWRSPIERTLRSRAVEFRVSSRPFVPSDRPVSTSLNNPTQHTPSKSPPSASTFLPTPNLHAPHPHNSSSQPSFSDAIVPVATSPIVPSRPVALAQFTSSVKSPPSLVPAGRPSRTVDTVKLASASSAPPPSVPSNLTSSAITRPRNLATQPHHRRRQKPPARRRRDLQRLTQQQQNCRRFQNYLPPSAASPFDDFFADHPASRVTATGFPLPADIPSQPQPLQEPLLLGPAPRYPLDLGIMSYDGVDLSGEVTTIEGANESGKSGSASASAAGSGSSSRGKTPGFDTMADVGRASRDAPIQPSMQEVAAAAAAAGERYLLNTVSTASASSRERESPPVDVSTAPDPAGLAAAATAAAQAVAGVDINAQTFRPEIDERIHQPEMRRRVSDPGIPSARDMAKVEAARDAISEEATRAVERESMRAKAEDLMIIDTMDAERQKCDASTEQLVAQMAEAEDALRGNDGLGEIDMPRYDFGGVFDSIDLTPFGNHGSGPLGFGSGDFRAELDSDEG